MTAEEIAKIICDYLRDRDDIAECDVVEVDGLGVVSGMLRTQGGGRFAFAVEPA